MELAQWRGARVQLLPQQRADGGGAAWFAQRPLSSGRQHAAVIGLGRRGSRARRALPAPTAPSSSTGSEACSICFEAEREPLRLANCGHAYCRACLGAFLRSQIQRANAFPLCCRDVSSGPRALAVVCGREIAASDVEAAVSADEWRQHRRLKLLRGSPSARECPRCSNIGVFEGASERSPRCQCQRCGSVFCFVHSAAHSEDEPCEAYEERTAGLEAPSRSEVARISQPCPSCGSHIEKTGGCNQMCCWACGANFCWLCGANVRNSSHACGAAERLSVAEHPMGRRSWSYSWILVGVLLSPFLVIVGLMYAVGYAALLLEKLVRHLCRRRGSDSTQALVV